MLRTNLATRPFYNERPVHCGLGAIAVAAIAVLVTSGIRVADLFQERATLVAGAELDEQQADEVLSETIALQRGGEAAEVSLLAAASREANRLIEQRAFSWTEFLNRIEATLPNDVMLTSLRPDVADRVVGVQIGIVSQSVDATDRFIERLEETGTFAGVLSREEEITEEGLYRAILDGRYMAQAPPGIDTNRSSDAGPVGGTQ